MRRYFTLKASNEMFLGVNEDAFGTLTASFPTPGLRTIFEFIPAAFMLGQSGWIRPLLSEHYVRVGRDYKACSDGWKDGAGVFQFVPHDGGGYSLSAAYQGCLSVCEDGSVVVVRVGHDKVGTDETFELSDGEELAQELTRPAGCCGASPAPLGGAEGLEGEERAEPYGWNDRTHAWLATSGMEVLAKVLADRVPVARLLRLWGDVRFLAEVLRGLYEADYEAPYIGVVYSSHFYDPKTRRTWLPFFPAPNALTECQKYALQAFGLLNEIDWSPEADQKTLLRAAYNLGLSLHYFTDLNQPMHAANFCNVIGHDGKTFSPLDKRHKGFEDLAEKRYERHIPDLDNMSETELAELRREVEGLMADSLEKVIISTAEFSRKTWEEYVEKAAAGKITVGKRGVVLKCDNDWSDAETETALRRSFTNGPKAGAAFLATLCGLTLPGPGGVYTYALSSSQHAPTFVELGGQAYMFWSSSGGTRPGIYYARLEPSSNSFIDQQRVYNPDPSVADLYVSSMAPSVAVLDGVLYVAWLHAPTGKLYLSYSQPDGTPARMSEWSPAIEVGSVLAAPVPGTSPALVAYKKRVFTLWAESGAKAGGGEKSGIWCELYDPNTRFTSFLSQGVPGVASAQTPAATVHDDRVFLAGRGQMTTFSFGEEGWSSQLIPLPGDFDSTAPACLTVIDGALHLFWRRPSDRRIVLRKLRYGDLPGDHEWYGGEVFDVEADGGVGAAAIDGKLVIGWTKGGKLSYLIRETVR
jgi:hypothetical protein